jgi:hypothetical protein
MARRQIRFDQIGEHLEGEILKLVRVTTFEWEARVKKATPVFSLDNYSSEELASIPMYFKVGGRTVPYGKSLLEHGSGGRLREAWQSDVQGFIGEVTNNVEYAEPVCYGTNLPPGWGGQYRTRQGTVPGFPDIIGKELQSWAQGQYRKIVKES